MTPLLLLSEEIFEIWKILDYTTEFDKPQNKFSVARALDTSTEIELPLVEQKFLDLQIDEDLHILPGEIPDGKLQVLMQDAVCLNFGILTNKELDFMLQYESDITLGMKEITQITDNRKENTTEITDTEIAAEFRREMQLPRAILSPVLSDKSKITDEFRENLPLTPRKRLPRQLQGETPTKRKRILENIELPIMDTLNVAAAPLEDTPMPEQRLTYTLPVKDMEMTSLRHIITDIDMELEPIHSSLDTFVVKKKNLVIDKRITLTDTILKKWRQNINFECRGMKIPRTYVIPFIDLLKRPLRCNTKSLCKLYINHIEKICSSANEDIVPVFMQTQEEIRELQKTTEDYTAPMTSKLIELEQLSTEQFSTVQAPPVIDRPLHQETRTDMDTDVTGSLEDIEILLGKIQAPSTTKNQLSLSSTCSSKKSHYTPLTSREILAFLEVLWCNQSYVKFSDLVPKNTNTEQNAYTKQDAATVFCILLELHAQKKLILHQTEFYHTLWIQKYEEYSD
ncbi:uncharacterized protein LOC105187819 isoform X2 [Harpegnathos saltator]|uniref:uncharacterized protein LOC105187819 isoform X2 n=1 Tax=Harpegnathos saltator TaxID=610380 RepID=UPI000DBEEBE7|nr:uncharacterized protein LOC105187819 isoform X2 [Harpegnathos saltator]